MKTYLFGKLLPVSNPVGSPPYGYYMEGEYVPAVNCFDDGDNVGYRDETLFGDGITDPCEVVFYETDTLGNSDIVEYILSNHSDCLSEDERKWLGKIVEYISPNYSNCFSEDEQSSLDEIDESDEISEIDKEYFVEIIEKVIGDRDFCVWLCKSPDDIYDSYVGVRSKSPDRKEYMETADIRAYRIPDDAMILSDLGMEGRLYVWKGAW